MTGYLPLTCNQAFRGRGGGGGTCPGLPTYFKTKCFIQSECGWGKSEKQVTRLRSCCVYVYNTWGDFVLGRGGKDLMYLKFHLNGTMSSISHKLNIFITWSESGPECLVSGDANWEKILGL